MTRLTMFKKHTISRILDFFEDTANAEMMECIIGNCRIFCYGYACNSTAAGEIHLANNVHFDRIANSRTIILLPTILNLENTFEDTLKKAIEIYE